MCRLAGHTDQYSQAHTYILLKHSWTHIGPHRLYQHIDNFFSFKGGRAPLPSLSQPTERTQSSEVNGMGESNT